MVNTDYESFITLLQNEQLVPDETYVLKYKNPTLIAPYTIRTDEIEYDFYVHALTNSTFDDYVQVQPYGETDTWEYTYAKWDALKTKDYDYITEAFTGIIEYLTDDAGNCAWFDFKNITIDSTPFISDDSRFVSLPKVEIENTFYLPAISITNESNHITIKNTDNYDVTNRTTIIGSKYVTIEGENGGNSYNSCAYINVGNNCNVDIISTDMSEFADNVTITSTNSSNLTIGENNTITTDNCQFVTTQSDNTNISISGSSHVYIDKECENVNVVNCEEMKLSQTENTDFSYNYLFRSDGVKNCTIHENLSNVTLLNVYNSTISQSQIRVENVKNVNLNPDNTSENAVIERINNQTIITDADNILWSIDGSTRTRLPNQHIFDAPNDNYEYVRKNGTWVRNSGGGGSEYYAGQNIQISDENVISATDTTYSTGQNISINSNNEISAEGYILNGNSLIFNDLTGNTVNGNNNVVCGTSNTLYNGTNNFVSGIENTLGGEGKTISRCFCTGYQNVIDYANGSTISPYQAFVAGYNNHVFHNASAVFGSSNNSGRGQQLVCGQYNLASNNAYFIVGGGTSSSRKNLFAVNTDGSFTFNGHTYTEQTITVGTKTYHVLAYV